MLNLSYFLLNKFSIKSILTSPVGAAIATPAPQLQCPLSLDAYLPKRFFLPSAKTQKS